MRAVDINTPPLIVQALDVRQPPVDAEHARLPQRHVLFFLCGLYASGALHNANGWVDKGVLVQMAWVGAFMVVVAWSGPSASAGGTWEGAACLSSFAYLRIYACRGPT